jgi:hypothetical protein
MVPGIGQKPTAWTKHKIEGMLATRMESSGDMSQNLSIILAGRA